jgi:voltage-gated potassium channel
MRKKSKLDSLRSQLYVIIFEAETSKGKLFDIVLIISIVLSSIVVLFDSVSAISKNYGNILNVLEWTFTIIFTIEYVLRIFCIGKPFRYMTSFFGIVDFLAVLPTYISVLFPGSHYLGVIRVIRLLRVFRVLKLVQYMSESVQLLEALKASRRKIEVFLFAVLTLVIIVGSLMYVIEGEENGFTSIPRGIYWAVVTLTTVGYGDISPKTNLGQTLAAIIMIIGYGVIAVPTGIVTAELSNTKNPKIGVHCCQQCSAELYDADAVYCKHCGSKL